MHVPNVPCFPDENAFNAIVNHYGLSASDEQLFLEYVLDHGADEYAKLSVLELLYEAWADTREDS